MAKFFFEATHYKIPLAWRKEENPRGDASIARRPRTAAGGIRRLPGTRPRGRGRRIKCGICPEYSDYGLRCGMRSPGRSTEFLGRLAGGHRPGPSLARLHAPKKLLQPCEERAGAESAGSVPGESLNSLPVCEERATQRMTGAPKNFHALQRIPLFEPKNTYYMMYLSPLKTLFKYNILCSEGL